MISCCNVWPFQRSLNWKGLKPKSPRGPDLVVCPELKVNTASQGEHKKDWVECGTCPWPTPTEGWSHSADAMKQNMLALKRSSVMDPILREASGMPPVFYQSHLVPSTAALPTAAKTTVKKDRFHNQDQELETWLFKRGLNVERCGPLCSSLLCCCYCVLGSALCCGLSDNLLWFDTVEMCAPFMLSPGHSGKIIKKKDLNMLGNYRVGKLKWMGTLVIMIADCSEANNRHEAIQCGERLRRNVLTQGRFSPVYMDVKCKKIQIYQGMLREQPNASICSLQRQTKQLCLMCLPLSPNEQAGEFIGCRWEHVCAPHIGSVHPPHKQEVKVD